MDPSKHTKGLAYIVDNTVCKQVYTVELRLRSLRSLRFLQTMLAGTMPVDNRRGQCRGFSVQPVDLAPTSFNQLSSALR